MKRRSGARPMTATRTGPVLFAKSEGLIVYQCFSDAGELQQAMFPQETLERTSRVARRSPA